MLICSNTGIQEVQSDGHRGGDISTPRGVTARQYEEQTLQRWPTAGTGGGKDSSSLPPVSLHQHPVLGPPRHLQDLAHLPPLPPGDAPCPLLHHCLPRHICLQVCYYVRYLARAQGGGGGIEVESTLVRLMASKGTFLGKTIYFCLCISQYM